MPGALTRFAALGFLCFAVLLNAARANAATDQEVDNTIQKAKAYIYSQQKPDGTWELLPRDTKHGPMPLRGSLTTLATYALLAAGESPTEPKLQRAIQYLKNEPIRLTYALGLRAQIWLFLRDKLEARRLASHDAQVLLQGADALGRYNYDAGNPVQVGEWVPHNSTSQYGVLGMWACAENGAEVPLSYWLKVEKGWKQCQGSDGGWAYYSTVPVTQRNPNTRPGELASPAFTAAGIASLFITQDYLQMNLDCRGNVSSENIDRGMKWLGDHFNEIGGSYTWYCVERIGLLGGYKYIGAHNWYEQCAEQIVRSQQPDGSWGPPTGYPLVDPCLNLLCLARGRAPVVINKLRYDLAVGGKPEPGPWNQRPRDCSNFVNWMDAQTEARLKWQVVGLDSTSDADLHDAPILYISGNRELALDSRQLQTLRRFVEDGGLIVGNADCGSESFSKAFVDLGQHLFHSYEFRPLPMSHRIFDCSFIARKWPNQPKVLGLSNGVRELMLLPDVDLSKAFQAHSDQIHNTSYQLLANIIFYAGDKRGLQSKSSTYLVRADPAIATTRQIKVARLQYAGNWNPEPGGWRRLAAIMQNQDKIDLQVEPVRLGEGKLTQAPAADAAPAPTPEDIRKMAAKRVTPAEFQETGGDPDKLNALIKSKISAVQAEMAAAEAKRRAGGKLFDVAHLTGTSSITFTDQERNDLKNFVNAGGLLFIDSAGGSDEFTESVQKELSELFGPDALSEQLIDASDPLYAATGKPIEHFGYRAWARSRVGGLNGPQVRALNVAGKRTVILSPLDISAGLVGQQMDGITGYDPDTATAIARSVVLSTPN